MCLCDKRAAALWIGPTYVGFYNEAFAAVAAERHPQHLGQRFPEMWPEPSVSEVFMELFSNAEKYGRSSKGDDALFLLNRAGCREEFWFSYTVVPVADTAGGVFGSYHTVFDTTAKQVQARRLQTMLLLGQKTALASNVQDFWDAVIQGCATNTSDLPFAVLYSLVGAGTTSANPTKSYTGPTGLYRRNEIRQWSCAAKIGLPEDFDGLPQNMDCTRAGELFSAEFRHAMFTDKPLVLRKSDGTFPTILDGVARSPAHGDPCDTIVLFSIAPTGKEDTFGFMVLGINPLARYDSDYQLFVQLLLRQCATSLASVMLIEEEAQRACLVAQDRSRLSAQLAETQKEAVENETRFRTMADMAPVGMFQLDAEGTVLYANKNWREITGHSSDLWGPMSWLPTVHADDMMLVQNEWAKLLQGASVVFEMRWQRPFHPEVDEYFSGELIEGPTWTIASAYAEKYADGSVKGILGCLTDISRQKWMEGFQRRRMNDLVELKRQQDNFMDLTSHEARNPLSAIMLCAESLIAAMQELRRRGTEVIELSRNDVEMHLDSAEIIMACAQHQKRIIDDVLTLSKLDSGLLVICPVETQPVQTIAQALKMFDGEVHKHDIKLTFDVDQSYHDLQINWMRLDPSRLLQVLINLLTNAIKFTQAEPVRHITITLCATKGRPEQSLSGVNYISNDWEASRSADDNVFIGLEVVDTGRGMTPDEMKRLFQKFQQASPKTHVEYGGSGLGLFISRQLTRMLGGAIGVASSGKGATFAFYMMAPRCAAPSACPLEAKENPSMTATGPLPGQDSDQPKERRLSVNERAIELIDPSDESKIHILIVEDNLVNQKVMRNQLERLQYVVTVANHGLEALDHIRKTHFCKKGGLPLQIVLMDVEMPVCNGLECARRIRAMQQSKEIKGHVPVIGVTANARAEQQAAVMNAGMDSVVTKPFRLLELSAELENVLTRFG
ncbi:hypothetical protein AMS68_003939 [Peltaster fructicola]|uniref:Histidine kinase n=1 Tax=Peltaster fructicola TaxID=286661 RepID=A0A6H0XUJ2_9PEZI|nr:hypothetical protein AMS68_003939 [Peltaster fructicola]